MGDQDLATTLGETAGDLLSMTLDVGYAVSSVILITLGSQLLSSRFTASFAQSSCRPAPAGTTMSDYMDCTWGLGYAEGSAILVTVLLCVLSLWRLSVGSLSVNDVRFKVELFYWSAILFSNTLRTALGDFLADSFGLGFGGCALLIASPIALITLAYFLHANIKDPAALVGVRHHATARSHHGRPADQISRERRLRLWHHRSHRC